VKFFPLLRVFSCGVPRSRERQEKKEVFFFLLSPSPLSLFEQFIGFILLNLQQQTHKQQASKVFPLRIQEMEKEEREKQSLVVLVPLASPSP
jgi:hypothetical protein